MLPYTQDTDLASIRLIACDMDRTLLADEKTQPPHMAERIDALARAGVVFCPASGRPGPTLVEMFPEHAHDMAFIADNGAAITYRGELIYKSLIEPDLYHELARATVDHKAGVPVLNLAMYDKKTLRAAQEEPEKYRDLIVRVWGFNARFVELDKGLQEHIIARMG